MKIKTQENDRADRQPGGHDKDESAQRPAQFGPPQPDRMQPTGVDRDPRQPPTRNISVAGSKTMSQEMANRCACRIDCTTSSRSIGGRVDSGQRAKPGQELDEYAGQVMVPRRDGRVARQRDRLRQQNHSSRNPRGGCRPQQPPAEGHAFQDEPHDDHQRRQAIRPGVHHTTGSSKSTMATVNSG